MKCTNCHFQHHRRGKDLCHGCQEKEDGRQKTLQETYDKEGFKPIQ